MVRLKEENGDMNILVSAIFQFHYGTIKSKLVAYAFISKIEFQFHYGTIKRNMSRAYSMLFFDFNSTMVRLKESRVKWTVKPI